VVFNLRETVNGFKHLRLKWTRLLGKRPDTLFIADYETRGVLVSTYQDMTGRQAACEVCGYAMIRLELKGGWLFETCSAMPVVKGIGAQEFQRWQETLLPAKLPTHRV
jgi:hypothetical protein